MLPERLNCVGTLYFRLGYGHTKLKYEEEEPFVENTVAGLLLFCRCCCYNPQCQGCLEISYWQIFPLWTGTMWGDGGWGVVVRNFAGLFVQTYPLRPQLVTGTLTHLGEEESGHFQPSCCYGLPVLRRWMEKLAERGEGGATLYCFGQICAPRTHRLNFVAWNAGNIAEWLLYPTFLVVNVDEH